MSDKDRLQRLHTIEPSSNANTGTPSSRASTPELELNVTTAQAFRRSSERGCLEYLHPLIGGKEAEGCGLNTTGLGYFRKAAADSFNQAT